MFVLFFNFNLFRVPSKKQTSESSDKNEENSNVNKDANAWLMIYTQKIVDQK